VRYPSGETHHRWSKVRIVVDVDEALEAEAETPCDALEKIENRLARESGRK